MRLSLFSLIFIVGCAAKFEKQRISQHVGPTPELEINRNFELEITKSRKDLTQEYFDIHVPNHNFGPDFTMEPKVVVVHYTVIPTLEKTMDVFEPETISSGRTISKNGALNVGIQFVVDRDGSIYSSYPENMMSRHVIGLNHVAIGIENIGAEDISKDQIKGHIPANGNGKQLTPQQLEANVALIRYLNAKYSSLEWVIGHYEYRDFEHPKHPGNTLFNEKLPEYRTEKTDPGKRFMKLLRKQLKK